MSGQGQVQATQNLRNLNRSANQVQGIGNTNPPNMVGVPENVLASASSSFNLNDIRTDKTLSDRSITACRAYEGVEGLRRLQKDDPKRSALGTGCGWIYKPSSGLNPEINRAALGTAAGPAESLSGGQWFWDLTKAEKEITAKICSNATKCSQLKFLGNFADICGYCKSSGGIIPITKTSSGMPLPRYPKDSSFMCDPQDIVTAGGDCPKEGFNDYAGSAVRGGMATRGDLREAFANVSFDDLNECTPPLSRDCVVLAARFAGCSDNGSLVQALNASGGGDYDSVLKNKQPYLAYKESANPGITNALLKDGSTAVTTALDDFAGVLKNTTSPNRKLAASARDLCLSAGAFDNYDFCAEMTDNTIINAQNIKCVQQYWLQQGGTEKGTGFPGAGWYGVPYKNFIVHLNDFIMQTKSSNKSANAEALKSLIGVDSYDTLASDLPRDENTRGAETVWIDLVDAYKSGSVIPIILRCDLRLAKDGEVYPEIANAGDLQRKYRVPSENVAYTSAFELRPENDTQCKLYIKTDDGMMVGINQNPFEGGGSEWGSWAYQGSTWYISGTGTLAGVKKNQTNTIVLKWFQGYGGAVSNCLMSDGNVWRNQANSFAERADIYLTQEPLAPWMQYELCTRPNNKEGNRIGLFEKRWNGHAAYQYGASQNQAPGFDVISSSVVFQTDPTSRKGVPGGKGYMSLILGSWWHTRSYFAFMAFKTITLLVRPMATLPNGVTVHIFSHANFAGFSTSLFLKNSGGRYVLIHWKGTGQMVEVPVSVNEWNLVVLQYVGDSYGIRNITCSADTLTNVKTDAGRRAFLQNLTSRQSASGSIIVGTPSDRKNAGFLVLGGTCADYKDASGKQTWMSQSFTGDVAWIHGFRNYLDTDELLKSEIAQSWMSRWPRGNIDGEKYNVVKSSFRV